MMEYELGHKNFISNLHLPSLNSCLWMKEIKSVLILKVIMIQQ